MEATNPPELPHPYLHPLFLTRRSERRAVARKLRQQSSDWLWRTVMLIWVNIFWPLYDNGLGHILFLLFIDLFWRWKWNENGLAWLGFEGRPRGYCDELEGGGKRCSLRCWDGHECKWYGGRGALSFQLLDFQATEYVSASLPADDYGWRCVLFVRE